MHGKIASNSRLNKRLREIFCLVLGKKVKKILSVFTAELLLVRDSKLVRS